MYDSGDSVSFQLYRQQAFLFEPCLQIVFGLRGSSRLLCGNTEYILDEAGLLAINPFELCQIQSAENGAVICLRIPPQMLRIAGWDNRRACACYARDGETKSSGYDSVRCLFASIFRAYFQNGGQGGADGSAEILRLLGVLRSRFASDAAAVSMAPHKEAHARRLKRILEYIHANWNQEISLTQIAETEYISAGYLSRFFQNHLRTTFSQYLSGLRLSHAGRMLLDTSLSVTNIAYECGFRNASAFIDAFRQRYHQTPGAYRREWGQAGRTDGQDGMAGGNGLEALLAYLPDTVPVAPPSITRQVGMDCSRDGVPLRHTWRRLLNIGYAHDGLLAVVREQIRRAQRDIGFEYLRFHGLLDEDMHIYAEDSSGMPQYDFSRMDMLFDFIRSAGLRPYIEFSFMPAPLAIQHTRIFDRASIISGCRDIGRWSALLRAVLDHCICRYGREEVRLWRFSAISQSYVHLGCIQPDAYEALYCAAYRAVKSADPGFCFGGPSCFPEMVSKEEGLIGFLSFAKQRGCIPDFIEVQYYPHQHATDDPLFMQFTLSQQSAPTILSSDIDYLAHTLQTLEETLQSFSLNALPVIVNECNSTLWQRDLSSDTCYKAVWLAKNICENHNRASAFGYWLLSDYIEERACFYQVFHGGYGLLTYNGIPKAGYQALCLLGRLGDRLVAAGEGWMLTRSGDNYQLLLYNYCHYGNLYRYRYQRLDRPEDAYSVFDTGESQRLRLRLSGLPDGRYRVERQRISRGSGSSFDKWLELAAPASLTPEETCYLAEISQPVRHVELFDAGDPLCIDVTLDPLEMELIVLEKKV